MAGVGAEVARFSVGDRVGVGCLVDSCRECEYCVAGEEQFCTKGAVQTYNGRDYDGEPTYGGYSRQIVVDERFVLSIPDSIELAHAAPLLCAGITTYSPLRHWNVGEGTSVAVVGMGGLGHVGVQIAAALGAEVTVLSQTLGKREDGLRFGAAHYYATSERETFKALREQLRPDPQHGLGEPPPRRVPAAAARRRHARQRRRPAEPGHVPRLLADLRAAQHGRLADRRPAAETQEMLDFCAEHGVEPEIELIGAGDVGEAYERVERSDVRYRFVIDVASIA